MSLRPQPPFPDDLVHAIGAVTLSYSALDTQVKLLTWRLIDPHIQAIGKIITASMPMTALLNDFSALFRLRTRDNDLIDRMIALVSRIEALSRERNDVIHAIWVGSPRSLTAIRGKITAKRGHGLAEQTARVHSEDVYNLAERIEEARQEIIALEYAITASSPALRDQ